jgi:uridine phosphorylase
LGGVSAEEPLVEDMFYHVPIRRGEAPRYVLLPGAPERVDLIASTWDEVTTRRSHREFKLAIGTYRGVKLAAVSTGIGGPSTSIAVEELARAGASTFIRVGTCGSIQEDIQVGDVVIATAAVRFDGASNDYAPPEYPAVASHELVMALIEAAERLGVRYHVGIVASTSTFYTGQSRPGYRGFTWDAVGSRLELLRRLKVTCFEMEAATLFTISSIYRLRAGCVCAVVANRITNVMKPEAGVRDAIMVANEAVRILSVLDSEKLKPTPKNIAWVANRLWG